MAKGLDRLVQYSPNLCTFDCKLGPEANVEAIFFTKDAFIFAGCVLRGTIYAQGTIHIWQDGHVESMHIEKLEFETINIICMLCTLQGHFTGFGFRQRLMHTGVNTPSFLRTTSVPPTVGRVSQRDCVSTPTHVCLSIHLNVCPELLWFLFNWIGALHFGNRF